MARISKEETPAGVPQPLHFLIVEDNPDGRESLRTLLHLYGHQVDVASDGKEGVEKALSLRPHIALVDIGLPVLDGYQVARRLREGLGSGIRLVACTAYSMPEQRRQATEAGFDHFLVKPFEVDELFSWLLKEKGD